MLLLAAACLAVGPEQVAGLRSRPRGVWPPAAASLGESTDGYRASEDWRATPEAAAPTRAWNLPPFPPALPAARAAALGELGRSLGASEHHLGATAGPNSGDGRANGGGWTAQDLRCAAVVLLGEAVLGAGLPGVPAAVGLCHLWEELLPSLWAGLLARRRGPALGFVPGAPGPYPFWAERTAASAWATELRLPRGRVLLDAGVDVVGEAGGAPGGGTNLVIQRRDRRLDPYRGVRVGEAAHPGPPRPPAAAEQPPKPPNHFAALGVTP